MPKNRIEIRGVIVPSDWDMDWAAKFIERGLITPESKFRRDLAEASTDEPLEIGMNTPGGSCFAGNEMICAINDWAMEHGQPVTVVVGAMAASMGAAIIATTPAVIKVHANSKIMFHGSMGCMCGGSEAMADKSELLDKINADMKAGLIAKTSLSPEMISEWFAEGREGWLTAEEAIECGLASEIVDGEASSIKFSKAAAEAFTERGMKIAALKIEVEDEADPEPEPTPEPDPEPTPEPEPEPEPTPEPEPAPEGRSEVVALSEKLEQATASARDWQGKHDQLQDTMKADAAVHAEEIEGLKTEVVGLVSERDELTARLSKLSLNAVQLPDDDSDVGSWEEAIKRAGGYSEARKKFPAIWKAYYDSSQKG